MKLNSLESALMNNPVRAASQWWIESPVLIGPRGALAGKRVLEIGCGRGVGIEILIALGAAHVTGFDLDPHIAALAQKRVAKYGDRARVFVGDAEAIDAPDSAWPIRALFDHPQATQFYGSEFRAGLDTAGLRVQKMATAGGVGYDGTGQQMDGFGASHRMNQLAPSPEAETRTVCGGRISDPDRYPSALYRGQRVYFCTRACLRAFESDPDRFVAGEIEHPTEDE